MKGKERPGSKLTAAQRAEAREAQRIAEIELLARQVQRIRHGDYRVPSRSEAGKLHTVLQIPDGRLTCTCEWNALRNRVCAHIMAVERRRTIEATKRRRRVVDQVVAANGGAVSASDVHRALDQVAERPIGHIRSAREMPPEQRGLRRVSFV